MGEWGSGCWECDFISWLFDFLENLLQLADLYMLSLPLPVFLPAHHPPPTFLWGFFPCSCLLRIFSISALTFSCFLSCQSSACLFQFHLLIICQPLTWSRVLLYVGGKIVLAVPPGYVTRLPHPLHVCTLLKSSGVEDEYLRMVYHILNIN